MPRPATTREQRQKRIAQVTPILRELKRQERSQSWLARKLGVNPSLVTYWKQGQREPRQALIAKAREVLSMPPEPRLTKARDSPHHAA